MFDEGPPPKSSTYLGWVTVGTVVAVLLAIAGVLLYGYLQPERKLERQVGGSCTDVGVMLVAGGREHVYRCTDAGTTMGCYALVDGDAIDVSRAARALATLGADDLGC